MTTDPRNNRWSTSPIGHSTPKYHRSQRAVRSWITAHPYDPMQTACNVSLYIDPMDMQVLACDRYVRKYVMRYVRPYPCDTWHEHLQTIRGRQKTYRQTVSSYTEDTRNVITVVETMFGWTQYSRSSMTWVTRAGTTSGLGKSRKEYGLIQSTVALYDNRSMALLGTLSRNGVDWIRRSISGHLVPFIAVTGITVWNYKLIPRITSNFRFARKQINDCKMRISCFIFNRRRINWFSAVWDLMDMWPDCSGLQWSSARQ